MGRYGVYFSGEIKKRKGDEKEMPTMKAKGGSFKKGYDERRVGTQFKKGSAASIVSGFYSDNFLPCNTKCPKFNSCPFKESTKDEAEIFRCKEEIDFFDSTQKQIEKEFNLGDKDKFQLPLMIMRMIKVKRQNRYEATKGVAGKTLLFNPKTGKEHMMDTPNVLNRDVYYAEKILMAWFDSLKLSRSSRQASNKIDIFAQLINTKDTKQIGDGEEN